MPRTRRAAVTLAEEQQRPHRRRVLGRVILVGLAVVVLVAAYVGVRGTLTSFRGPRCEATTGSTTVGYTPEQMGNAATIVGMALRRGLPARAATIAIATALQESKLRNLEYGDRDSVGLFQQRPSQGWGTVEQLLDPEYSTTKFYDALVKIKGYETMEITKVAQAVQRSAAPEAYADHEQEGRVLADTLSGYTPAAVVCRLTDPSVPGHAATVSSTLTKELGMRGAAAGRGVTVTAPDARHAWAAGAWSVAKADSLGVVSVVVGDRQWTRAKGSSAMTWEHAKTPVGAKTVRITLK